MAPHPPSPLVGPPPRRRPAPRRSRLLHRTAPLVAFAAAAFVVGIVLGSRHEPSERRVAARFASAWERADYATMHSLLTAEGARRVPAAPLPARLRARRRHGDAVRGADVAAARARRRRRRRRRHVRHADLRLDLQPPHAGGRGGRAGRHAGRRLAPGAGVPGPARGRAAPARDDDAAARRAPGPRRHGHRAGRAAPLGPRPDRVGDRRPARPRAARARGGAGPPRRPGRHAGGAQRPRAHLRRAAGRHARAAR